MRIIKSVLLFGVCLIMLISCNNAYNGEDFINNEVNEKVISALYKDSEVVLNLQDGYFSTSLTMDEIITPYKSPQETAESITSPYIFCSSEKQYILRNYPAELDSPEEYDTYKSQHDVLPTAIEVYENNDYTDIKQSIPIPELGKRKAVILAFSVNGDGSFSILARYLNETGELKEIFVRADRDGKILRETEHAFSTDQEKTYIPYGDAVYHVMNSDFYVYNPFTGENTKIDSGVQTICIRETKIYYLKKYTTENYSYKASVWSYDLSTQTTDLICNDMDLFLTPITMAYDTENKVVYYADYDRLFAYSAETGKSVQVGALYHSFLELRQTDKENIYIVNGHNELTAYKLPEYPDDILQEKISLRVCLFNTEKGYFSRQYHDVLLAMEANGIGVSIEETYIGQYDGNIYLDTVSGSSQSEYIHTMAKKLLAEDTDFDLFVINSTMHELRKVGYYDDLSQYPILNYYFDQINPGYRNLCSIDGVLSFVPQKMTTIISQINTEYTENQVFNVPTLLEDIPEYAATVSPHLNEGKYVIAAPHISILMQNWFYQYSSNFMAHRVDDETAYNDLVFLFEMYDELMETEGVKSLMGKESEQYLSFGISDGHFYKTDEKLYPIPLINENYGYPVSLEGYAINPNSENRELTALFLAYLLESERGDQRLYYSDSTISDEGALFNQVVANGVLDYKSYEWLVVEMTEVGTVDVLKSAEQSYKKLKMIRDE